MESSKPGVESDQPTTTQPKLKRPTKEEIQALKKAHWEEFLKNKQERSEADLTDSPYDSEDTALPSFDRQN